MRRLIADKFGLARQWLRATKNGVSPISLLLRKFFDASGLRFRGEAVRAPDMDTTWRIARAIWGSEEYDIPGFVPQPGWRVVDVGGNVGIYAMLAADRGAEVEAYEPHPESARFLRINTARWPVTVHQAAVVGAPAESVTLFIHPERDTRNTVLAKEIGTGEALDHSIEAPAVTLDAALAEPCDLLKIDCEGGEFDIFANGGSSLRNAERIIAEVHRAVGDPSQALADVRSAGFEAQLHDPDPEGPFMMLTATRQ